MKFICNIKILKIWIYDFFWSSDFNGELRHFIFELQFIYFFVLI